MSGRDEGQELKCNGRTRQWRRRAAERLDVDEDDDRLDGWLPPIDVGPVSLREVAREGLRDLYCDNGPGHGVEDASSGRCKHHGGASLSGPASGTWKHGGRSKYAHPEVAEAEEFRREHGDLVERERRLLELESLLRKALEGVLGTATVGADEVGDVRETLDEAVESGGQEGARLMRSALQDLRDLEDATRERQEALDRYEQVARLEDRVVRTEIRRRKTAHDMMSRTRVLSLAQWLIQGLVGRVEDVVSRPEEREELLRFLSQRLRLMLGQQPGEDDGDAAGAARGDGAGPAGNGTGPT